MVEGVSPWKNFDEIEDSLILDELLLLNDMMTQKKKYELNVQIALAGGEPDFEDDGIEDSDDDSSLPAELIEAEKAWRKKKFAMLEEVEEEELSEERMKRAEFSEVGLGYKM